MKLKSILYILMLLPFLWSCNNEDDVEEIFASGTWHVVDFYNGTESPNTMQWHTTRIRLSQPKEEKPWISFMVSTLLSKRMALLQEAYKTEPLKAHGKRMEKTGQ